MKKNLLIAVILILTHYSWGQSINLINKTVSDKNCKTLYIGVENELIITSETPISIQPQAGVTVEQNKLIVRPISAGQLTIVFNTEKGKIPMTFDIARIPDPLLIIGGQYSYQISKDVLLADNSISLKVNNDKSVFINYGIISFTVKFKDKTFDIKGNKFSTEILSELNAAKTGDSFTIASIVCRNNDVNKTLNLNNNYTYSIK